MIVYFPTIIPVRSVFKDFFLVGKFHLKNTQNNFIKVPLKFHVVPLLLSFMKFSKKSVIKLVNHGGEGAEGVGVRT